MATLTTHQDNIVLGNGELFFDLFDDSGNKTGERYLGQTPGFTLTTTSETLEKYTSDGPIAELMASVTTQVSRTGTVICDDMSAENMALFFVGEAGAQEQAEVTGATSTFNAIAGRIYQLGKGVGAFNVTNVTVTKTVGSTELTLGTDYTLDAEMGRITILDAAIGDTPTAISVAYDTEALSIPTVQTTSMATLRGSLRFHAFNAVGIKRHVYMPLVELSPDGEVSLQSREDFQQLTFTLTVQKPATGEAIQFYEI